MARNGRGHFHSDQARRAPMAQRGMTLIELLVVVFILSLLLATALPLMKPAIEVGKIRDAARQINAFFAGAKARAAEIGRPVGVWIERIPGSNAATQLYLAETPPIYIGDSLGATAQVTLIPGDPTATPPIVETYVIAPAGILGSGGGFTNSESLPIALAPMGEVFRIKFGFQGLYYRCKRIPYAADATIVLFALQLSDARHVPPILDVPRPYQIQLNPRRSSAMPLQLPGGVAIDLKYSGIGGVTNMLNSSTPANPPLGLEFWDNQATPSDLPVIIVFRPSGDVVRIINMGEDNPPAGTIHLLVGKIEQVDTLAKDTPETPNPIRWSTTQAATFPHYENLVDGRCLWISIGHRTGLVTSSENGWNFDPDEDASTPPNFFDCFRAARQFGQRAQTAGGR